MKFCTHCGKELLDEAVICTGCGCACQNMRSEMQDASGLTETLSSRLKTNGIIWICIAAIQILLGLVFNWILLIIGALNLISGIQDISFGNSILSKPVGIVKKLEPLAGPIIILVYNLIFGGIIGVAGSIFYLVSIRSFVISNKEKFLMIEENNL